MARRQKAPPSVSTLDLPTLDKIPVIRRLMAPDAPGLALDIGSGTGYTTGKVFAALETVCVDLHAPNLVYMRQRRESEGAPPPACVIASATALPFAAGSFRYVLCSEVLEHLEDDETAVAEIARVLQDDGTAVVTVPYTGLGFTSFLDRLGIKTVHDYPGPEHHVRPGYDERSLAALFGRHGLELAEHDFYLRLFTRLIVDGVSLCHLAYQRFVKGRRGWTWSQAAEVEGSLIFRAYALLFPLLRAFARADALLCGRRGFGLVAKARRRPAPS